MIHASIWSTENADVAQLAFDFCGLTKLHHHTCKLGHGASVFVGFPTGRGETLVTIPPSLSAARTSGSTSDIQRRVRPRLGAHAHISATR